jgi:hypothetical protein
MVLPYSAIPIPRRNELTHLARGEIDCFTAMTLQQRALARAFRFRLGLSLEKLAPLIECAKIVH